MVLLTILCEKSLTLFFQEHYGGFQDLEPPLSNDEQNHKALHPEPRATEENNELKNLSVTDGTVGLLAILLLS